MKDPCYAFDNINISRKNGLSIRLATLFVNLELGLSQLVQVFKTGVFGEKIIVMRSSLKKLFTTHSQQFSFQLGVFRLPLCAVLLSSVCFVNSYASSVCNVNSNWSNGSSAVGNTCTVTRDTFNPQYNNNYQGAALVSGNGSVLTVKGDLSNIAPGERGITDELKQLKELDSNTIGKTKLEMGAKNEVITITDSGGQSYTINVYPPQSFIETDWGDSRYLTPKAVQDNQYISAGFGKAENGGHLIVHLDNFKGNGFLDPKRTVYLALKNSNLT